MRQEFRKRLLVLQIQLDKALESDNADLGLLPALFSVFSYLWCNSNYKKKLFNK